MKKYVALAKDKNSDFRLMGFGHRVYKNFDPRAKIIKTRGRQGARRSSARRTRCSTSRRRLEEAALKDSYFVERKLYPNVDFYSGIIYRAMGFPTNMFTVLFALGRLPGWIAHWKEMMEDPTTKIAPPAPDLHGPHRARLRPDREAVILDTTRSSELEQGGGKAGRFGLFRARAECVRARAGSVGRKLEWGRSQKSSRLPAFL